MVLKRLSAVVAGAALCLPPLSAFAESPSTPPAEPAAGYWDQVHGGLLVRVNFATLVSDDIPETYLRVSTGYSLGGFVSLPVSSSVTVQAEGVYTRKGGKLRVPVDGFILTDTYAFDYLEFAPMLQIALPLKSELRVFGELGPVLGIKLAGEVKSTAFNGFYSESMSQDVTDELEPIEFGVAVGAGLAVPFGDVGLLVGLRYHMGLTSVSESFAESSGMDAYSRNLQIQGGIYF